MRLIDADAYIKYCDDLWIPLNVEAVKVQPTIDAIPVVRCKDCKWRDTWVCNKSKSDNWFCPKGRKKEE